MPVVLFNFFTFIWDWLCSSDSGYLQCSRTDVCTSVRFLWWYMKQVWCHVWWYHESSCLALNAGDSWMRSNFCACSNHPCLLGYADGGKGEHFALQYLHHHIKYGLWGQAISAHQWKCLKIALVLMMPRNYRITTVAVLKISCFVSNAAWPGQESCSYCWFNLFPSLFRIQWVGSVHMKINLDFWHPVLPKITEGGEIPSMQNLKSCML